MKIFPAFRPGALALALGILAAPVAATPLRYTASCSDSSTVNFTMRNQRGSVEGRFKKFELTLMLDRIRLKDSTVDFQMPAASVDTGDRGRDEKLRSPEFFDFHNHPYIEFHSKRVVWRGKAKFDVIGDLTVRGVTRPLTLNVTDYGMSPAPLGETDTFRAEFKFRPREFGVVSASPLDSGGTSLGDEIPIKVVVAAIHR